MRKQRREQNQLYSELSEWADDERPLFSHWLLDVRGKCVAACKQFMIALLQTAQLHVLNSQTNVNMIFFSIW